MIDRESIPLELRTRKQWLIWKFEPGKKKPLKVPYWVNGKKRFGTQGDDKDRANLTDFDTALIAATTGGYTGVGFAFLKGDGLVGIDIDGCIDADGVIGQRAADIIAACNSYTEYSPSNTGVHIIVAGETETFKSNDIGLEVFCGSQFFTFTAKQYGGMPCSVTPISESVLNRLRKTVKGSRAKPAAPTAAADPALRDERARLESALAYVSADHYDQWIRVGMAILSTLGDSGFAVWDYWSSKSESYSGSDECRKHWKSFGTRGTQITGATVYKLAQEGGWAAPRAPGRSGGPNTVPIARPKPTPVDGKESPRPPEGESQSGDKAPDNEIPAPSGDDAPDLPDNWDEGPPSEEETVGAGGGKKRKKAPRSEAFWNSVNHLLEHFVLLYGTSTAWDCCNRMQIKIPDLRYAFGTDPIKFWLGNGERRMINSKNLVFDPTMTVDDGIDGEYVNMFDGFKVVPKEGECDRILDLLSHLCDGDQVLVNWILRWIAYPLQHPGAKMATSIIMHGDEGSGKNLFWETVVRRLYGEHAGVIGNAQIEAQFNEWASQKLFFVCDEVVTRNELRQLKGKLKGLISGDEIRINPKNLPERSEANHLNLVFLSNELQPLALDKTDRRYLVVWTPAKRDADYYKAVATQAESGGVEAFYHYLLHKVDCSDFSPHTKPLDTKAKAKLISLGLSAPERFYREWAAGNIPLPFISCSAMQLYAAFLRWSHLNGERFPPSQTLFGGTVERMAAGEVVRKMVKYDAGSVVKQRTVYQVGQVPEGKKLQDWIKEGSDTFEIDLRKYRHVYDQSDDDVNPAPSH